MGLLKIQNSNSQKPVASKADKQKGDEDGEITAMSILALIITIVMVVLV